MMGLVWNGACAWTFFISCIISIDVLFICRSCLAAGWRLLHVTDPRQIEVAPT